MLGIQTKIQNFNINPKLLKRIIAIVVIVAVAVTGVIVYRGKKNTKQTVQTQQTTKVRKGDFNVSITGTGSVASASTANVAAKTNGTVTKVYHGEGDTVKAGDLLYEMDDSSSLLNIEKIKNNISTAQLSANTNLSDISKLEIRAPFSGIVTSLPVKVGDTAAKNGQIATIVDQSRLKLTVPMKVSADSNIGTGTAALVHVQTIMQTIDGVITQVSSPIITSDGMQMLNLEVTVPNTGTLKEGLKATVEINSGYGSVYSTDTGTLAYVNSTTLKSETGGTVSQLYIREGSSVNTGDLIMTLGSNDLVVTKQTNDIKLKDLNTQLDTEVKQLDYYKVYATIDGTITKQALYVGDAVKAAEDTTTISNVKMLQCTIPIDELDIAKVQIGQKTNITADALTDTLKKPLQGEVKSIGAAGNTTNGVTTYPVVISIPYTEGIRIGMNVNVEIFIQSKQNTTYVPIEAVQKIGGKSYVVIKGGTGNAMEDLAKLMQSQRQQGATGSNGQTQQKANNGNNNNNKTSGTNNNSGGNNRTAAASGSSSSGSRTVQSSSSSLTLKNTEYYKNTTLKEVELGINNDTYIEILSGVSEGDEVVLPPKASATSSSSIQGAVKAGGTSGLGMFGGQGGQQQQAPSQGASGGLR